MAGTAVSQSIPQLSFAVEDAQRVPYAAAPTLRFDLRVDAGDREIRSVLLDVQIQIAARRRGYEDADPHRLFELFGHRKDWGTTLRTLLWTRTTVVVPPFTGRTVVPVDVACSYDLEVLATRYFDALSEGSVPLELLFSGSVFYAGENGALQTTRIPWEQEAEYALPVRVWKETMDRHFRGTAWLRLPKESYDALCAYRSRHALASWDAVVERLLAE
jgi:Family of unknown function (DUF6084)